MTFEIAKEVALDFIDKTYPDVFGAIMTGSFVNGDNHSKSDIDLVILDKDVDTITTTFSERINDVHFDIFIISAYNVVNVVMENIKNLSHPLPTMIIQGIPLKNHYQVGSLIELVKNLADIHYPAFSEQSIEKTLSICYKLLGVLEKKECEYGESFFLVSSLVQQVSKLHSNANRSTYGHAKFKAKIIKRNSPVFYERLTNTLKTLFIENNSQPFLDLIHNEIRLFSAKSSSSRRQPGQEPESSDIQVSMSLIESPRCISTFLTKHNDIKETLEGFMTSIKYFYLENNRLYVILESRVARLPINRIKQYFISIFRLPLSSDAIAVKEKKLPIIVGNPKLVSIFENVLKTFYKDIVENNIYFFNNVNMEDLNFTIGLIIWNNFRKNLNLSEDAVLSFSDKIFDMWIPSTYSGANPLDIRHVVHKRRLFMSRLEKDKKNTSKMLHFAQEINRKPDHMKDLIDAIKKFFTFSFLQFKLDVVQLRQTEDLQLPIYDLCFFNKEDKNNAEYLLLCKMLIEKIYSAFFFRNMYIYPYLYITDKSSLEGFTF